ncbi:MAG: hypothetical protein NTW19_02540 [Planctomycetota bacterium]|nr:hypothetical protein [Planctomycetota bacterium]
MVWLSVRKRHPNVTFKALAKALTLDDLAGIFRALLGGPNAEASGDNDATNPAIPVAAADSNESAEAPGSRGSMAESGSMIDPGVERLIAQAASRGSGEAGPASLLDTPRSLNDVVPVVGRDAGHGESNAETFDGLVDRNSSGVGGAARRSSPGLQASIAFTRSGDGSRAGGIAARNGRTRRRSVGGGVTGTGAAPDAVGASGGNDTDGTAPDVASSASETSASPDAGATGSSDVDDNNAAAPAAATASNDALVEAARAAAANTRTAVDLLRQILQVIQANVGRVDAPVFR